MPIGYSLLPSWERMKTLLGLLQRLCCGEQILRGPHSLWPRTSTSLCGERPSSGGVKGSPSSPSTLQPCCCGRWDWVARVRSIFQNWAAERIWGWGLMIALENTVTCEPFKCLLFTWIGASSCKNERRFWGHGTCNQKGRLSFGGGVEYRGQSRAGKHKRNALSTVVSGCFQIHSCLSAGVLVWQSQRWRTTQSF